MSGDNPRWTRANLALAVFALNPAFMGGIRVCARSGPVRDRFMDGLTGAASGWAVRRIHPNIGDHALLGGVDLSATLAKGCLVRTRGVLADPAVLVLPMAERTPASLAGRLAGALDRDRGLALVALDEGIKPDEVMPSALADRMALHLDLSDLPLGAAPEMRFDLADLKDARALLPWVILSESAISELVQVAHQLGVQSLRAPLLALAVARASAALSGAREVESPDLVTAVELVLVPRATQLPAAPEEQEDDTPPLGPEGPKDNESPDLDPPKMLPQEILLKAVRAILPPDILARMEAGRTTRAAQGTAGSGVWKKGNRRGRPMPSRPGSPSSEARIDLVGTLRAAAPWQPLRRRAKGVKNGLHIRAGDIRLRQFEERSDRAIIFVVDASGSAALARLAEAKGAVEILLSDAYARRDYVAMIAFRGVGAAVLLPPTRSLVQTKRRLCALPGGGGTPLASGLMASLDLAALARVKGMTPSIALLTDGRANVALDGRGDRAQAVEDARQMGRLLRAQGVPGLVIDMGHRPATALKSLASAMAMPYLALPRADAQALSAAVGATLEPI
ncbi:MAG: magnesium chelatase subunit D [Rhodobacteraceae bacterium]|nr:magnesium chelatase subunit D [Paracoccaceae bacterium]